MRIVVGYNDFTSGPENSPKLTYNSTYTTRTVSPGASLAGWSISESNTPNFFIYRGKLAPPAGFSVLWGDPSMAVSPKDPNLVYYAMMGASEAAWKDANNGQLVPITTTPGAFLDSLCIAQSVSAGFNFEKTFCAVIPTVSAGAKFTIDQTSIAVDSNGCIWVALTDTTVPNQFFTRLFRSKPTEGTLCGDNDFKNLEEIVPPLTVPLPNGETADTGIFINDRFPRVKFARAHDDGHPYIYLGTINIIESPDPLFQGAASVTIREFDVAEDRFTDGLLFTPDCDSSFLPTFLRAGPDINVKLPSGQPIRIGRPYDFAVGRSSGGQGLNEFAVRVAMQVFFTASVSGAPNGAPIGSEHKFIQVLEKSTSTACINPPTWSTNFPLFVGGQEFQPTLHVTGNTTRSQWWLGYLTNGFVSDINKNFIRTEAQAVAFLQLQPGQTSQATPAIPSLLFPTILSADNAFACPRKANGAVNGYWGDYWDLTSFGPDGAPTVVGVFSKSLSVNNTTCEVQTDFQAKPLKTGASNWSIVLGSGVQ